MRKIILASTLVFAFILALPANFFAQEKDNHTVREEAEGREIFSNLQAKKVKCENLTGDDFEALGEYFMGQSIGDTSRHIVMNTMMVGMMGKEGEEQMHAVMGKRLSGCDSNVPMPSNMMEGTMSMMTGFGGGNTPGMWGFGLLFVIFSLIFSVLILIILVLLAVWIWKQIQKK